MVIVEISLIGEIAIFHQPTIWLLEAPN